MGGDLAVHATTASLLPLAEQLTPSVMPHFLTGLLLGRFTAADWPRSSTDKRIPVKGDDIVTALGMLLNYKSEFCYIRAIEGVYLRVPGTHLYLRCPDERVQELVVREWTENMRVLGAISPRRVKEAVEMVKAYAKEKMDTISRRYIAVAPELYWDTELGSLTDAPKQPVFYRLFDTDVETNHIRKVPPFTEAQLETLRGEFERILRYQEEHDGDLPEDFEFVQLWANFSHDLYVDIMKASAAVFMRRKPMGAFMPVGTMRNGKTAWSNDFMKTMVGLNNTSAVQLANLGNPHQAKKLQWTLYNAPDEEREIPSRFIEEFKTICDHGHLDMDKFFSQDPIPIHCDFVCVCPMNSAPEWQAKGTAPLMRRSLVMPFTHDFAKEDANPVPFPERTFTAEMFSHMLGHLFAIAAYYRNREMKFSYIMESYRETLEEEASSHILYYQHFIAFFDGFQSLKQLYDDYKLWCASTAHECQPVSQGQLKLVFGEFFKDSKNRSNASINGVKAKVLRIARPGCQPMVDKAYYKGRRVKLGTPEGLRNASPPQSIVERMEADLEAVYGDKWEDEMRQRVAQAKQYIDGQKKVAAPAKELSQPKLGVDDDIFKEGE